MTIRQAVWNYAHARVMLGCDVAKRHVVTALDRRSQRLRERRRQYEPKRPLTGAQAMMKLMERRRDPYVGSYLDD